MSDFLSRIAGAPITWGVDGSPGWGHLMDRNRVLDEMRRVGLQATELGPDGYLPTDPEKLDALLGDYGLAMVGAFVPLLLYRVERIEDNLAYAARASATLAGAGAKVLVLGPSSHLDGYDTSVTLSEEEWAAFAQNATRVHDITGEHGLATALHPHWGMAVERPEHIERVLETCPVGICLDTGHVYLGGGDPVQIARMAGDRVVHVHLKDVDPVMADEVRSGKRPFRQAVIDGLFVPLGRGGVDIAGVIRHLERTGFAGWYVLEHDQALAAPPAPGEGPIIEARTSMAFLNELAVDLGGRRG